MFLVRVQIIYFNQYVLRLQIVTSTIKLKYIIQLNGYNMLPSKENIEQELSLLSQRSKFQLSLSTPYLLMTLKNTTQGNYHQIATLLSKIEDEIKRFNPKTVYVGLKWLNFIHTALQIVRSYSLAEALMGLLRSLVEFSTKNKYEEYLFLKMVKPYKQYLAKLAEITVQKLGGPSPSRHNQTGNMQLLFCEFNLLVFGCQEFISCTQEFHGYFKQFYPCLNNYINLLSRDMQRIYRRLKLSSERKTLRNINDLQIEMIESKIQAFAKMSGTRDAYSWLLTESATRSEHIESPKQNDNENEEGEQVEEWGVAVSFFES